MKLTYRWEDDLKVRNMSIISLTTDFGDLYPAAMKAVILGINPGVQIVDVTHSIRQAGIREGAFALYSLVPYFPAKTVHIGVVDPGVGTSRRALAIKAGKSGQEQFFVGPDNGLLIPVACHLGEMEIYEITNRKIMLRSRHRTNYAQVSNGCLDFQDHNHQLKSNFIKNLHNLFCDSYLNQESLQLFTAEIFSHLRALIYPEIFRLTKSAREFQISLTLISETLELTDRFL